MMLPSTPTSTPCVLPCCPGLSPVQALLNRSCRSTGDRQVRKPTVADPPSPSSPHRTPGRGLLERSTSGVHLGKFLADGPTAVGGLRPQIARSRSDGDSASRHAQRSLAILSRPTGGHSRAGRHLRMPTGALAATGLCGPVRRGDGTCYAGPSSRGRGAARGDEILQPADDETR